MGKNLPNEQRPEGTGPSGTDRFAFPSGKRGGAGCIVSLAAFVVSADEIRNLLGAQKIAEGDLVSDPNPGTYRAGRFSQQSFRGKGYP